jgi:hypothetical protein
MHKLVPAALPLGLVLPLAAHSDTAPQAAALRPEIGAHREGGQASKARFASGIASPAPGCRAGRFLANSYEPDR